MNGQRWIFSYTRMVFDDSRCWLPAFEKPSGFGVVVSDCAKHCLAKQYPSHISPVFRSLQHQRVTKPRWFRIYEY